jgi:transposase-like protein
MSRPISRQDVIDCAKSEYSISDTAEELHVSYQRLYRFIREENLAVLFRHGNASVKKLKKSNVARGRI